MEPAELALEAGCCRNSHHPGSTSIATLDLKYRLRVNGVVMPRVTIRTEMVRDKDRGWIWGQKRQVVIHDPTLGRMALDDNEQLSDPALSKFVLEIKDLRLDRRVRWLESATMCADHTVPVAAQDSGELMCPTCGAAGATYTLRRGWRQVTVDELLAILDATEAR
jgi:hypothetical protein